MKSENFEEKKFLNFCANVAFCCRSPKLYGSQSLAHMPPLFGFVVLHKKLRKNLEDTWKKRIYKEMFAIHILVFPSFQFIRYLRAEKIDSCCCHR